jgi:hypothetical protein
MIKKVFSPTSGLGDFEAAISTQLAGFYTPNTYQTYGVSNHFDFAGTCIIGNYIDSEHNVPVPFLAVNTAGEGVTGATWVVSGFRAIMDFGVNPAGMKEQAGLFGIEAIPIASGNWDGHWALVGHVWDSSAPAPYFMTPIVITAKSDGTTSVMSSEIEGTLPPLSWVLTNLSALDNEKPCMLNDIVYDAQNDACVAVGNCVVDTGGSLSMYVELLREGIAPTYFYNLSYGTSANQDYPAFLRSCSIQTQDTTGATVSNRTIVTAVGFKDDGKWGTWAVYQPNYSNAWGGGAVARWAWIEKGVDNANDFFTASGLDANDKPTYLTMCRRLTADGEDIYLLSGITPNGLFAYGISGIKTDSGGVGVYDNIINSAGTNTTIQFAKTNNEATLFRNNTVATLPTNLATSTLTDAVAIGSNSGTSGRRTKLYAVGYAENGRNAPLVPTFLGSFAYIMAVSRGLKLASTEVTISAASQSLLQDKAVNLQMSLFTQSSTEKLAYVNASYRPLATGAPSALHDFSFGTGNRAVAWFEYLMYDGIDSLVARKLHEMGVRVTIANVEWYKQDILKESLDVSSDFFTEWATEQQEQNIQRDRLAELQGRPRPRKRQVRTELFDDYADMEEKEAAVKNFPDYDPFKDGEPFKDDVERQQEIQKTQKAVDDLRRIEDTIDEAGEVQSEQREEDGAYDIGDNEEP